MLKYVLKIWTWIWIFSPMIKNTRLRMECAWETITLAELFWKSCLMLLWPVLFSPEIARLWDLRHNFYSKKIKSHPNEVIEIMIFLFYTQVKSKHGTMPFNLRQFEEETKARMGVVECVSHKMIDPFQVLYEKPSKLLTFDCYFVSNKPYFQLNTLLNSNIQFFLCQTASIW